MDGFQTTHDTGETDHKGVQEDEDRFLENLVGFQETAIIVLLNAITVLTNLDGFQTNDAREQENSVGCQTAAIIVV